MADLDSTDLKLLELLQQDDRIGQATIASTVGMSVSSINERMRKLVERGVIAGFHARVAPEALGYDLLAFVHVGWSDPAVEAPFLAKIAAEARVLECHHVTGVWNYVLKVRVRNTKMLEGLLAKVIKAVPGVERTETIIALSSIKETLTVPTAPPDWM